MKAKILFLVPYPHGWSPSQRFRLEQYLPALDSRQYEWTLKSFWTLRSWQGLFVSGQTGHKILGILWGYTRRFSILFSISQYKFVFIHREATPLGPPVIEWVISHVFRKKIIYDFDDAIWLKDNPQESLFFEWLKWRSKVRSICRWSFAISAGNEYLCEYARRFNSHVFYNPTTIDTEHLHNPALFARNVDPARITIGWTGSHSTLKYLKQVEPVLHRLMLRFDSLAFVCVADRPPEIEIPRMQFVQWSKETEIQALVNIDIGIMPLPDDEWANGKCGFKALQYMALQKATVASPVGVNTSIIQPGVNGFLANTEADWENYLTLLITNEMLREQMGQKGRQRVEEYYSVVSNTPLFLSLFEIK